MKDMRTLSRGVEILMSVYWITYVQGSLYASIYQALTCVSVHQDTKETSPIAKISTSVVLLSMTVISLLDVVTSSDHTSVNVMLVSMAMGNIAMMPMNVPSSMGAVNMCVSMHQGRLAASVEEAMISIDLITQIALIGMNVNSTMVYVSSIVPILMVLINAHVIQDSSFIQIDRHVWTSTNVISTMGDVRKYASTRPDLTDVTAVRPVH